ncbi:MAG: hypothetical protein E4G98_02920, partial [Promethearchaeota archaeon]
MSWLGLDAEEYDKQYSDKELISRLAPFFSKYRKYMIIVIIFISLGSFSFGIIPYLTKLVLDQMYTTSNMGSMVILIAIVFIINFLGWIF